MVIRTMMSGAAATRVMTDAMNSAPKAGLAQVDIASILGSMFNDGKCASPGSPEWRTGMAVHYALGTVVFPAMYNTFFKRLVPGGPLVKSLAWAGCLYVGGQFVVMPALRKFGYFKNAPDAGVTYLIGHIIYGSLFGTGSGDKAA